MYKNNHGQKKKIIIELRNRFNSNKIFAKLLREKTEVQNRIKINQKNFGLYHKKMKRITEYFIAKFLKNDAEYKNVIKKIRRLQDAQSKLVIEYKAMQKISNQKNVGKDGDVPTQPAVGSGSRTESP